LNHYDDVVVCIYVMCIYVVGEFFLYVIGDGLMV